MNTSAWFRFELLADNPAHICLFFSFTSEYTAYTVVPVKSGIIGFSVITPGTQNSVDPPAMRGTSGQVSADNENLKITNLH